MQTICKLINEAGPRGTADPGRAPERAIAAAPSTRLRRAARAGDGMQSVRAYLDDVRLCKRLSVEEERTVVEAAAAGDAEAQSQLVKANLRLVVHVAAECHRPAGFALADMIQEGNIGLMIACKRFNPGRGVRFSTFAVHSIRHRIQGAAFNAAAVRLPRYIRSRLAQWRRAETDIGSECGRHPTDEEISDRLKLAARERRTTFCAVNVFRGVLRLSELAESNLVAEETDDPALEFDSQREMQLAREALDSLPEREAGIVRARCGFDQDGQPSTYEEIARQFGISKEGVRQIERRALETLRRRMVRSGAAERPPSGKGKTQ